MIGFDNNNSYKKNYFYKNLKYIRNKKRLSMEKFGNLINQSSANISRWENNDNGINLETAIYISNILEYPIEDLLYIDLENEEQDISKIFSDNLKKLREKNKSSQSNLAKKISIDHSRISRIEACENMPSLDTAWKISKYFNVSLDDMLNKKL